MPDVKASPSTGFPLSKGSSSDDSRLFIDLINVSARFKTTLSRKHFSLRCEGTSLCCSFCSLPPCCASWRRPRLPPPGSRLQLDPSPICFPSPAQAAPLPPTPASLRLSVPPTLPGAELSRSACTPPLRPGMLGGSPGRRAPSPLSTRGTSSREGPGALEEAAAGPGALWGAAGASAALLFLLFLLLVLLLQLGCSPRRWAPSGPGTRHRRPAPTAGTARGAARSLAPLGECRPPQPRHPPAQRGRRGWASWLACGAAPPRGTPAGEPGTPGPGEAPAQGSP